MSVPVAIDTKYSLYQEGNPKPLVVSFNVSDFSRSVMALDRMFYLNHPRIHTAHALAARIRNIKCSIVANRSWLAPSRYVLLGEARNESLRIQKIHRGKSRIVRYLVDRETKRIVKTDTLTEAARLIGRTSMVGVLNAYLVKRWYHNRYFLADTLEEANHKLIEGVPELRRSRRLKKITVYREGTDVVVAGFTTSAGFAKYYEIGLAVARSTISCSGGRPVKVPKHSDLIFKAEYYE